MRYKKFFPQMGTPWLGLPIGQPHESSSNIQELPRDVSVVRIGRKTKNIDQLHRFKKIKALYVSSFQPEWVEQFEQLPKLEYMKVSELHKAGKLPSFKNLTRLRALISTRNKGVNWSFLKGSGLHSLCLGDLNDTEPVNLSPIGGLSELRELYVSGNVEVKSLAPIGKLAELRYLFLFIKTNRGKLNVKPLAKLQKLTEAQLGLKFHIEQLDYLFDHWPKVKRIKLNAGLSWPPSGPREERPTKGRVKFRTVTTGNIISAKLET